MSAVATEVISQFLFPLLDKMTLYFSVALTPNPLALGTRMTHSQLSMRVLNVAFQSI